MRCPGAQVQEQATAAGSSAQGGVAWDIMDTMRPGYRPVRVLDDMEFPEGMLQVRMPARSPTHINMFCTMFSDMTWGPRRACCRYVRHASVHHAWTDCAVKGLAGAGT
jgi:hypothetical protein